MAKAKLTCPSIMGSIEHGLGVRDTGGRGLPPESAMTGMEGNRHLPRRGNRPPIPIFFHPRTHARRFSGGAVAIPGGVTGIDNMAFSDNVNVTGVTVTGSVRYIGRRAFFGCAHIPVQAGTINGHCE